MNIKANDELFATGKALLVAARRFWEVHQEIAGPRAVVWLEGDGGGFVLFTRGEYKNQIMANIGPLTEETHLVDPFVKEAP